MGASEGKVTTASGELDRTCPACGVNDDAPRHLIVGVRTSVQMATLQNGQQVQVQVPLDEAYHIDCHAGMSPPCDHCAEMLDHNKGKVDGSIKIKTPPHLEDIEPHEFALGVDGQLHRLRDKAEARSIREAADREVGLKVVDADKAHALHLAHSKGEVK